MPLPASTVILLREGSQSPETLMIERHSKSDFLPDLYVFPGGRVEEQDHALADRVHGLTPADAARLLTHASAEMALGFFVAAIRETFEEAGILLARRKGQEGLVKGENATEAFGHRLEVQSGEMSFRDLVERYDLELAGDLLAVHAHWITPQPVPRRFDTIFFTALAPAGQLARHDGIETTDHVWIRPESALEQMRSGKRRIIFPTALNLETLCGFSSGPEALEASRKRPVVPVLPRIEERDGGRVVVIPQEAGYPRHEFPAPGA